MKLRVEADGYHLYDRALGLHVLIDEVTPDAKDIMQGPSLVSVALTNVCDLSCSFCYAPKSADRLDSRQVLEWCKQFASLGTLEVAFGGGEPALYPCLSDLCRQIWSETDLGISITTHGHHLDERLIHELAGSVSVVRVSIDAVGSLYSTIRGRPFCEALDAVDRIRQNIPVAINTVINAETLSGLDELCEVVVKIGAIDWLLLPETNHGRFTLSLDQWASLDNMIARYNRAIPIRVTAEASAHLTGPFGIQCSEFDYAHISADGLLKRSSYDEIGIKIGNKTVASAFEQLRSNAK